MSIVSSRNNSNTAIKSRQQPKQEDIDFLNLLKQMESTGKVPDTYGNIGRNTQYLDSLIEGLEEGLDGFLAAKKALLNRDTRLQSLYSIHQADQDQAEQAEQETLHPDFRIGKQGKQVFKTLSEDDIECFPDIKWMVSGLLLTSTVSMLFGESNTGKTFVALDIAEHVARGLNWLGHRVKQGNVLYIYAESRLGLKPRIQAWKKHHDLPSTPNLQFITRPVQLVNDRDTLLDTIAEQEVAPALVVIDTFSNCAIGVNQNDQAEVTNVLMAAHELVRAYGCHVLIVHHTNKTDSVNGSAAFKNHVDTMIKLSRADKYSPVVIHCEKQRDTEQFDDIAMQLQVVDLYINQYLEPVTSCVVVAGDMPKKESVIPQTQQKMLEVLSLLGRSSYNEWERACVKAEVVKPTSFYKYVQSLVNNQLIKKDAGGKGKPTWYEVLETTSTTSQVLHSELLEVGTN